MNTEKLDRGQDLEECRESRPETGQGADCDIKTNLNMFESTHFFDAAFKAEQKASRMKAKQLGNKSDLRDWNLVFWQVDF